MTAQTDADQIRALANVLDARAEQLRREIAELERLGIHNATYYYRDGRYLYVNWNDEATGRRVRSYIGTDPAKCQRAIADIDRYRQRARLLQELQQLGDHRKRLDLELTWLRSRYRELAAAMVTPASCSARPGVTSGGKPELQTDWVAPL